MSEQTHADAKTRRETSTPLVARGVLQRKCACGGTASEREDECDECQKKRLQRQALGGPEPAGIPAPVRRVLATSGEPLDRGVRGFFEPRFGHDFSQVRVHSDEQAARSARDVNALAYTVGSDVVFGRDQFRPSTVEGRKLLAHELTHVVQQSTSGHRGDLSLAGAEREAEAAATGLRGHASALGRRPISIHYAPIPADKALTDVELFDMLVNERAHAFAPSGAPSEDPKGLGKGVGPQAGGRKAGDAVFAIIQIKDRNGKRVALSIGAYFGGGDKHAEQAAIGNLDRELIGKDVEGGEMTCVVDQDPCGPDRKNCDAALDDFAKRHKLRKRVRVPKRPKMTGGKPGEQSAKPKTSARGAQRKDYAEKGAAVELEDFPRVEPAAPDTAPAPEKAPTSPPEGAKPAAPESVKPAPTPKPVEPDLPAKPPAVEPPAAEPPKSAVPPPVAEAPKPGPPIEPQTPKVEGELPTPKTPTVEIEPPKVTPKVTPPIEPPKMPEPKAPGVVPEIEPKVAPRLGAGGLAKGLAGEAAGAAAGVLFDFLFLAAWLVDEFIIAPWVDRLQRALAKAYAKSLTEQINKAYTQSIEPKVRKEINCVRAQLRRFEAANKKAYVKVSLRVIYIDKSSLVERAERAIKDEPLTDIFKLDFLKLILDGVELSDAPSERSGGELKKSEVESDDGPTLEQSVTFSFEAPTIAQLQKEFGVADPEPISCCFIATACCGSPFAPEVIALQRFRDRGLTHTAAGQRVIAFYYRVSPPFAEWLKRHDRSRRLTRSLLIAPLAAVAARRYPAEVKQALRRTTDLTFMVATRQPSWRLFKRP